MKKILFLIIALFCALLIASCSAEMPEEELPVSADTSLTRTGTVYCSDGTFLVPVAVETRLGENSAQQLIESMQTVSDETHGLTALIPEDAIISVSQEGSVAHVSITGDPERMDGEKIVCSAVNTLTQCGGIDAVSFTVNGVSEKFGDVDITQPISEYCINPAYDIGDLEPFQVFFQNDDGLVIPMTKATNSPNAEIYIKALMTVPESADGLKSLFPADTRLNSAVLTDGTLTLDFSGEFYGISALPDAEENLLTAIDTTCRQLEGVERISIFVDGVEYTSSDHAAGVFANRV